MNQIERFQSNKPIGKAYTMVHLKIKLLIWPQRKKRQQKKEIVKRR